MLQRSEIDAIVGETLQGDKEAFRKIVREYSLSLRSFIAASVHGMDAVDDLAQEVFFAAFRNLREFRRGDDFGHWLRGIARNKIYKYLRSSSRRNKAMERFLERVVGLTERSLERAVAGDRSESIEVLLLCVGRLPDRLRRVVHAGLEGDKPADLACELNTTVGAIYRLHYRANQLLRDCMQEMNE
ncbi:RNA polymerase sigma factor [Singulisphaera sp. PoT]|uniref:RNA polymerase sigma factor n=1 Tax=Singulisphaera sp. PoT TaxID=3411797 RepID=UPI003BF5CC2B